MTPLKIIMVDDEAGVLLFLELIIEEIEGVRIVGKAENAADTIKLVKEQNPDIAFLDIELPDMNGIELARMLKEINVELEIVFVSAYDKEYLPKAVKLEFGIDDFISKPIDKERVIMACNRLFRKISGSKSSKIPSAILIKIKDDNEDKFKEVLVELDKILYIEKEKSTDYVIIHCMDKKYKTRQSLDSLNKKLDISFFRSHNSYIVNTKYVKEISGDSDMSSYIISFGSYEGKALLRKIKVRELKKAMGNIV